MESEINISLKDEVEHRLREAQKNKTFQDSEYRVPGSKKEMAAIRKLIETWGTEKGLQMGEKEYGEVSMTKFVKKGEVFPEFDVKKQLDMGISSGATFLKLKLRSAYPGEPKVKNKESRIIYTAMANYLYTSFERIPTVEGVVAKQKSIRENMQLLVCKFLFSENNEYVNLARNTLAVVADGADYRTDFIDFEDAYNYLQTFFADQLIKDRQTIQELGEFLMSSGINRYELRKTLLKTLTEPSYPSLVLGASQEQNKAINELIAAYKRVTFMSLIGDFDSFNFGKQQTHPFWTIALKALQLHDKYGRPIDVFSRIYDGDDFVDLFFGTKFANFINYLTFSYGGTQYENYRKAVAYEGISEDKSIVLIEKCQTPIKQKIQNNQELLSLATNANTNFRFETEVIKKNGTQIPAFYMRYYQKDGKVNIGWRHYFELTDSADQLKYRELYIADLEKAIEGGAIALEKCKEKYAPRPDDWSWAAEYLTEKVTETDPETGEPVKREKSKKRKIHERPMLEYIERVGGLKIDKSKIEDRVHIQKFMTEVFGFHGYIFGISLKDSEAREIVYHFLGAISDLAEILNIDLAALNKKMGLNMGFASHGSGTARASYQSLGRIINLTKSNGDGSVAHEMAHYLDNIIPALDHIGTYSYLEFASAQNNGKQGHKSDLKNGRVYDAMQQIMAYILYGKRKITYNGTINYDTGMGSYVDYVATAENAGVAYIKRVQKLESIDDAVWAYFGKTKFEDLTRNQLRVLDVVVRDAGLLEHTFRIPSRMSRFYQDSSRVGGEYWVRPWELFARAFEVYVSDKLIQAGRKNNFLCHGEYQSASEEYVENYPYPQFEERKYLFGLFENLIAQVKSEYGIGDFVPFTDEKNTSYKMEIHVVSDEQELAEKQYAKKLKLLANLLSEKTKEIILGTGGDLMSAVNNLPAEEEAFAQKVFNAIDLLNKWQEDRESMRLQRGPRYDIEIPQSRFREQAIQQLNELFEIPDWEKRIAGLQDMWEMVDKAQSLRTLKEELLLAFANKIIHSLESGKYEEEIYLFQLAIDVINSVPEVEEKAVFGRYDLEHYITKILENRNEISPRNHKKNRETIEDVRALIFQENRRVQFDESDIESLLELGRDFEKHRQFGFTSVQLDDNYGHSRYIPIEVEEVEFVDNKKNAARMTIGQDPNGKYYLGVRLSAATSGSSYGSHLNPKLARDTKAQIYRDFYENIQKSTMWPDPVKNKLLKQIEDFIQKKAVEQGEITPTTDNAKKKAVEQGEITPTTMVKLYDNAKKQYPTAVLLFKSKSFYEAIKEDAKIVSDNLGTVLVQSAAGYNITGFPECNIDKYLPKLIRAGIRVATVDANYATGGRLYPSLETEPQIVSEKDLFGEDTSPQKKADKGADKGTLVNVIPEIDLIRLDNSELVDLGNRKLNGSADSFSVFKKIFPANKIGVQEYFYVLYVNRANDVIAYYNVSKGGTTGTVVDIEMVCNAAVKLLAKGVVVAHNHPSGNLTPSAGDKAVTQNLKTALKTLEIVLIDHLILAPNNRYFSFADDGIL